MGVVKATVSMTVYLREEDVEDFRKASLDAILHEVDEGGWIGSAPVKSEPMAVPEDHLRQELQEIGNDGSFFDDSDVDYLAGRQP